MSLKETLIEYTSKKIYPMHMPGHKRQLQYPYSIDMTEVEGVDDLHDPGEVIAWEQHRLAKRYGADHAFMLVGGSTVGNLSAIYAACNEGDLILIQRNSHKSVYNGATIRHLKVGYIKSEIDENGIYRACTLLQIKEAIGKYGMPKAIVITSPTYEGYYCDIAEITDYCREKNIITIVDEAHGAHLGLDGHFPNQASSMADITICSLHKTLPALTQTAALFLNNKKVEFPKIRAALDIFETSSPSYVLMNSISECLDFLEESNESFRLYVDKLKGFYKINGQLKNLKIIEDDYKKKDIGKIVISTKHAGITGVELARILREKYEIETELSSFSYVLAMTSVMDSQTGFDRLKKALLEIDKELFCRELQVPINTENLNWNKKLELWEAKTKETVSIELEEACGHISGEMICIYPPGAPIIVPGEEITKAQIDIIKKALQQRIHVTGVTNGNVYIVK